MTIAAFPDTNVFLQCRDLKELPWGDISGGDDVELLVAAATMRELDRFKGEGNTRRGRRARAASSLFGRLLQDDEAARVVREANPRVTVCLSSPRRIQWDEFPNLDPMNPDHQLVAEACAHRDAEGRHTVVVSHDVGPVVAARSVGLAFQKVPDSWLAQPEPDERDRRIANLEKQLVAATHRDPVIDLQILDQNGARTDHIDIDASLIADLTEEEIERLIEEVQRIHPMATFPKESRSTGFPTGSVLDLDRFAHLAIPPQLRRPSEDEIRQYQTERYPTYLKKVRQYFSDLVLHLELPNRQRMVVVKIANTGTYPARDLLMEFEGLGGVLIADEDFNRDFTLDLPSPPPPPKSLLELSSAAEGHFGMPGGFLKDLSSPQLPTLTPRDSDRVYWRDRPADGNFRCASRECTNFRHTATSETKIWLAVPRRYNFKGALRVTVKATNLAEPVVATLPVSARSVDADLVTVAAQGGVSDNVVRILRAVRGTG